MRPRRVLILSLEYTPQVSGGVGTHAQELARGLDASGCAVTVVACSPGRSRSYCEGGLEVHLLGLDIAARERRSVVGGILAINEQMVAFASRFFCDADRRPEIIQCYNWLTYRAAHALGRQFDVPAISTVQYISEPVERWWGQTPDPAIVEEERFLFATARRWITVSESMRDVIARTHGVDGSRVDVVYNGLDPSAFARRVPPAQLARLRQAMSPDGGKVVFFAGRLSPQKGVEALLESACLVAARQPAIRYVCAGEADSESFGRFAASLTKRYPALDGRITLLGKTPRLRLPYLYQAADVAVVPSVYEPFGYAAIEAMAAGTPLIVSRTGGLAEIVEHGKSGLHVPVHDGPGGRKQVDVPELAEMQLRLLSDEALARMVSEAASQVVLERFHRDRMVEATLDAYAQARASYACSPACPCALSVPVTSHTHGAPLGGPGAHEHARRTTRP